MANDTFNKQTAFEPMKYRHKNKQHDIENKPAAETSTCFFIIFGGKKLNWQKIVLMT